MKISQKDLESVRFVGANNRPVTRVEAKALKDTGIPFATSGIAAGEYIEFPENVKDHCYEQPTRVGGTNKAVYAVVMRGTDRKNMKPSPFSLGSLVRQDGNREYTCDFTAEMGTMSDNEARLDKLAGKTIFGASRKTIKVQKFENNRPVEDASGNRVMIDGNATVIEYAE